MDEEYIDFLNSLSVQENPEMRFISFDGFLGNKLSRTKSKSEPLKKVFEKTKRVHPLKAISESNLARE